MGNKAVQHKNQLLETYGTKQGGIADSERNFGQGLRTDVLGKYDDLYSGIGDRYSGGGYVPQYADAKQNEYAGDYRNWADTGGFDTGQMQDYRARATSTLTSFY